MVLAMATYTHYSIAIIQVQAPHLKILTGVGAIKVRRFTYVTFTVWLHPDTLQGRRGNDKPVQDMSQEPRR